MRNIVSGEESAEEFEFCMTSLDQGYELYNDYVDKRLIEKSVKLLETISRNKTNPKSTEKKHAIDKETNRTMKVSWL